MANPNIDDKFKAFFEERTLAPNENAWDRMESLMPATEIVAKRDRRPIYWVAAATFVGFFTAWFMWNQNVVAPDQTVAAAKEIILNEDDIQTIEPIKDSENIAKINNVQYTENDIVNVSDKRVIKAHKHSLQPIKRDTENTDKLDIQAAVQNQTDVNINEVAGVESEPLSQNPSFTKIKIDPDRLLQEVDRKLKVKKQTSAAVASSSVRPDPSKLLEEAEIVSKRTTVQRIFKSLQNNSESVMAAVANRNYQK